MNLLLWIGKIFGCFLFDLFIDKGGYKNIMYVVVGIQIVGVICKFEFGQEFFYYYWIDFCEVEMSVRYWLQFMIGRDVIYFVVGFVENVVLFYNVEILFVVICGFFFGFFMFFIVFGNFWGVGMLWVFVIEQDRQGWMILIVMQFILVILIVGFVFFMLELF